MTTARQIIKVFLGSPGDLTGERELVRGVVDDINRYVAPKLGYYIELLGWEDTLPGFGRPQARINKDVDGCDLFIGMLWRWWGSPPDNQYKYSSGFEEEYYRAVERREQSGVPEVCIYLKAIDDESRADPGESLSKVLEFRDQLIAEKRLLYKEFGTELELHSFVRNQIEDYLLTRLSEGIIQGLGEAGPAESKIAEDGHGEPESKPKSAFAEEGHDFLVGFAERILGDEKLENIDSYDIARIRLLANSLTKHGNAEPTLGVHDLNLIYSRDAKGLIGSRERTALIEFGLQRTKAENVPLWHWLTQIANGDCSFLPYYALGTSEATKEGALIQMRRLQMPISDEEFFPRQKFLKNWISSESSDTVRNAALRYLRENGIADDVEVVLEELAKDDSKTESVALESVIAIMIREDIDGVIQKFASMISDTGFDETLLAAVEELLDDVSKGNLLTLLSSAKNATLRAKAIDLASNMNWLSLQMAEKFAGDPSARVRHSALVAVEKLGKAVSIDDAKKILVQPKPRKGFGLLGFARDADSEGEEEFEKYNTQRLLRKSESELEKMVASAFHYDDAPYFALAQKNFSKYGDSLRQDTDDSYSDYITTRIERLKEVVGEPDEKSVISRVEKASSSYSEELVQKALELLCSKNHDEDLSRIRRVIRSQAVSLSETVVDYFRRNGKFSDIDTILSAKRGDAPVTLLAIGNTRSLDESIARCIYALGKASMTRVLRKEIPIGVLRRLIPIIAQSRFARLPSDILISLLGHDNEGIRRVTCLKGIISMPLSDIKKLHAEYIQKEQRYYNVIHWLDAGVSLTRVQAKTLCNEALHNG